MDTIVSTLKRMQEIHDATIMDIDAHLLTNSAIPISSYVSYMGAKMWEAFGWIAPFTGTRLDQFHHTVVRANKLLALQFMASAKLPAVNEIIMVSGTTDMYVLADPSWKIFHTVYKNCLVMLYTQDLEILGAEIFTNVVPVSSFTVPDDATTADTEQYSEYAQELERIWEEHFYGRKLYYPAELDSWLAYWTV